MYGFMKNNLHYLLIIALFVYFVTSVILPVILFISFPQWDVLVYYLNGLYLLGEGDYYEVARPPLISLIYGILGLQFDLYSSFIFYVFIFSFVYLLSVYYLIKETTIPDYKTAFFFIILISLMSPLFVFYSFVPSSTEIFSGVMIIISLLYIIKSNKERSFKYSVFSGLFMSFSSLVRYQNVLIAPLLFLIQQRRLKVYAFLSFILPWMFWGIYNKIIYGRFFYSFVESYFLNIYARKSASLDLSMVNYLEVLLFLMPSFVMLSVLGYFFIIRRKKIYLYEKILLFFSIYLISVISFLFIITPFKLTRYLYGFHLSFLFLSIIVFGNMNLSRIVKKYNNLFLITILVSLLVLVSVYGYIFAKEITAQRKLNKEINDAIYTLKKLNSSCVYSDYWVYFVYNGMDAYPYEILYDYKTSKFKLNFSYVDCNVIILLDDIQLTLQGNYTTKNFDNFKIYYILSEGNRFRENNVIDNLRIYKEKYGEDIYYDICKDALKLSPLCQF